MLDPVAKILTGVGAMGTNAGALTELGVPAVTAMLGSPLLTKLQDMGSDAAKSLGQKVWGQGHPIADVLAQVAGGAAAGATSFGPLGAINAGEGESAAAAAAKEAAPDATDTEEAVESQAPAASGGVAVYARGSVSNAPIPPTPRPVTLTPAEAVDSLAQKQAAALQSLRAVQTVAERIGRPDIATTVPESETMAAGEAQNLTPEQVAAEAENVPVATRMAALTSAMDAEAADLHKTGLDLVTRAGNGENVDRELSDLDARYGAFATDSSTVQIAQGSELARGLQISRSAQAQKSAHRIDRENRSATPRRLQPDDAGRNAREADRPGDHEIGRDGLSQSAGKASVGQMLYSLYRFGMLADLKTPLRILLSNAATSLAEVPVRAVASVLPGSGRYRDVGGDEHASRQRRRNQRGIANLVQERDRRRSSL